MTTGRHHRARRYHYGDLAIVFAVGFATGFGFLFLLATQRGWR